MTPEIMAVLTRVVALHGEAVFFLNRGDSIADDDAATAAMKQIAQLLVDIEPATRDEPALLDVRRAQLLLAQDDLTPDDEGRAVVDSDECFVDLALQLRLPGARAHYDLLRGRWRPKSQRPRRLHEQLQQASDYLTTTLDALGLEPWRSGSAGAEHVIRLRSISDSLTVIGEWMEPTERLAVVRRAARTLRRLRLAPLHMIADAWSEARAAAVALAALSTPTVLEGGASRRRSTS